MIKDQIKQLAKLTIQGDKVNPEVATYVLNKLSRKELMIYTRFLKTLAEKNMVTIISSNPIPAALKRVLEKKFTGKQVVFETNGEVGDGIIARVNDTIMDLSMPGYVATTIENLKQN